MALQISYTDQYGTIHSTAYGKITTLRIDHHQHTTGVVVGVYKDAAAAAGGSQPVGEYYYKWTENTPSTFTSLFGAAACEPLNMNPRANTYAEIKQGTAGGYPEWQGASDV